jgi:hypothetical protein
MKDVHGVSPGDATPEDIEGLSNLLCVLAPVAWQQFRVRSDVQARLTRGLTAPSEIPTLSGGASAPE